MSVFISIGSNPSRTRQQVVTPRSRKANFDDLKDRADLDFGAPLFHGLPTRNQQAPPYNSRNNDDLMLR